jgi:predicted DNA-binding protein
VATVDQNFRLRKDLSELVEYISALTGITKVKFFNDAIESHAKEIIEKEGLEKDVERLKSIREKRKGKK